MTAVGGGAINVLAAMTAAVRPGAMRAVDPVAVVVEIVAVVVQEAALDLIVATAVTVHLHARWMTARRSRPASR